MGRDIVVLLPTGFFVSLDKQTADDGKLQTIQEKHISVFIKLIIGIPTIYWTCSQRVAQLLNFYTWLFCLISYVEEHFRLCKTTKFECKCDTSSAPLSSFFVL